MTYEKQNFINGETVLTAEHLNHIEEGIINTEKALENYQPKGDYPTSKEVDDKITSAQLGGGATYFSKVVDLVIFMGQSNMAGRGTASNATIVPEGHGYEFRAISDPTKLYHLEEPFGVNENNSTSGVSETNKTGSLVSAFANSYYEYTGIPIVGVSCSKGGTNIEFWQPNGAPLNDAINRHNTAKNWLIENGYTIRHDFMVWCQGESDAAQGTDHEVYTSKLKALIETMMAEGVEKCFIVRIGKYVGSDHSYDEMISLQTEICKTYENTILVSTDFAGMAEKGLMKDEEHFLQEGYNIAGSHAGIHTAHYIETGVPSFMYDPEFENLYVPYPVKVGSGAVTVDDALSAISENPVQNKVVTLALGDALTQLTDIRDTLGEFSERLVALENGSVAEFQNVTYELTNVISSTTINRTAKGKPFTATLSVIPDYVLSSVVVTMGGADITESNYNNSVVQIAEVTGDIVITAVATEVVTLLNLDFTKKSLDEYVSDGIVSKNGAISSIHSDEGDLFSVSDTANLTLSSALTFPTNFEIYLRMKSTNFDNSIDDTGLGGISIFNANGNRPMINLRAPNTGTGSPHTSGFALQSRLVSSGGDNYTISDVTIPINDGIFHDVILHYEGNRVYMSVDGTKSATVTSTRNSNTVTHLLGYRNNYNFNNVLVSCLKVYEIAAE